MKQILTLVLFSLLFTVLYAQKKNVATVTAIKYQGINPDPFLNMPVTQLGLDYYYVQQNSKEERLWYEIIVIGNKLVVHFHAKGSLNIAKVDYEYDGKITDATITRLKAVYKKAALKQRVKGVPVTDEEPIIKEVLITKSNDSLIGGGWYYHNAFANKEQIKRSIDFDKGRTTSLLGKPELMIDEMKKLAPKLPGLLKQANGGR